MNWDDISERVLAWVRPGSFLLVLIVVCYQELMGVKVSDFFIGLVMGMFTWIYKSRDDDKAAKREEERRVK